MSDHLKYIKNPRNGGHAYINDLYSITAYYKNYPMVDGGGRYLAGYDFKKGATDILYFPTKQHSGHLYIDGGEKYIHVIARYLNKKLYGVNEPRVTSLKSKSRCGCKIYKDDQPCDGLVRDVYYKTIENRPVSGRCLKCGIGIGYSYRGSQ